MERELILLSEYCENSRIELDFLVRLEEEGLIEIEVHDQTKYLPLSQLSELELFARLHYDLSVNIEGIDIIRNLLARIRTMEQELGKLQRQIGMDYLFEQKSPEFM